ncbi:MAG: lipid kinase [Novosphingobium sp.]|nr:lipid kinase [Novosphingobium sp.]
MGSDKRRSGAKMAFRIAFISLVLLVPGCGSAPTPSSLGKTEAARKEFNIGWSIYTGYMPWRYAQRSGIAKKWSDKYHIKINFVQVNEYIESVNQFSAGKLDGVAAASMDLLAVPAAGGKDTTVLIIEDYSNGNDGIVLKNGKTLADIKGRTVNLVELSVSHYLLARGMQLGGMKLRDVKTMNTSDADVVGAFASPDVTAVATWNPQLLTIRKLPGAVQVFDSSKIPNELLDVMAVSTETLRANPDLGKALTGIWYDVMAEMHRGDATGKNAVAAMAKDAGSTTGDFEQQLATTYFYKTPKEAGAFAVSHELVSVTDRIRKFSFEQGILGPGAKSADDIGIEFPGNHVLGDRANIKLRFDQRYMKMALDGKL